MGRPPHPDVLTPAEWRVLEHVRAGHPNAEIAVRLGISVNTVRYHVSNMLAKLEQPDRQALAAWDGEPRERFAWLPSLPPISLGLGGMGRWVTLSGIAIAAVVVLAVVLAAEEPAEPHTSMALRMSEGGRPSLVAMDLATGVPLTGVDRVDFTDSTGGFLGDGSLIWTAPFPSGPATQLSVFDGGRFGFGGSGFKADGEGLVQRWELPETPFATLRFVAWAPGNRWVYAMRRIMGPGPNGELWRLDLRGPDVTLLATVEDEHRLYPARDGRLFVLGGTPNVLIDGQTLPSQLLQIDPRDGSELARLEFRRTIQNAVLSSDESLLYVFPATGPRVQIIDFATMAVAAEGPDEVDPQRPNGRVGSWALSPDERRLYVGGSGSIECADWETPCEAIGGRVQIFDLETMQLVREESGVNQVVVSGDGRWIVVALLVTSDDDSNLPERVQGVMGDGLRVIDASTFEVVAHLERGRAFFQLSASADGRFAYGVTRGPGWADLGYGDGCTSECFELVVIDLDRQAVAARQVYTDGMQLVPVAD